MKRRCLRRVWASTAVPLGGNGAASSTLTTSICADSTQFMNRHAGSGLMAERAVWQERGGEANVPTHLVWKHGHACTQCTADFTGGRSSLAFFFRNRLIKPSGTAARASPSLSSSISLKESARERRKQRPRRNLYCLFAGGTGGVKLGGLVPLGTLNLSYCSLNQTHFHFQTCGLPEFVFVQL